MRKPRLFISPINGLGNRLLMITSAFRVASLKDYALVIVWMESAIPSGRKHFHGPFSTYFETGISEIAWPLTGEKVFLPERIGAGAFILDDSIFDGSDIYLGDYFTHNIFLKSDFLDRRSTIDEHYYSCLKRILTPSEDTALYLQENYVSDVGFEEDYLGIHIRKGGFLSNEVPDYIFAHNINNSMMALSALKVLAHLSKRSAFICGQNYNDAAEVAFLLRNFGVSVMVHRENTFPHPLPDHTNSAQHSTKAVADLITLQKSSNVLSTYFTTFGLFASIRPNNIRFVVNPGGAIASYPTSLLSGNGL